MRRLWWRLVDWWRWHVHGVYDLELTFAQLAELERRGLVDDVRAGIVGLPDEVAAMFDPAGETIALECARTVDAYLMPGDVGDGEDVGPYYPFEPVNVLQIRELKARGIVEEYLAGWVPLPDDLRGKEYV